MGTIKQQKGLNNMDYFELINNLSSSTVFTIVHDLEQTLWSVEERLNGYACKILNNDMSLVALAELECDQGRDQDYFEQLVVQINRLENELYIRTK